MNEHVARQRTSEIQSLSKAYESHQVDSLSACWAAIRASQWLGKLLLFPNQGEAEKSTKKRCMRIYS